MNKAYLRFSEITQGREVAVPIPISVLAEMLDNP